MKVTLLQTDIVWCSPEENQILINQAIDSSPKSDLYVLPEMFSTGFVTTPEPDVTSLDWMRHKASNLNAAIAGSLSIQENSHFYNRFYFVKPDGSYQFYDKRHLFSFAGENLRYTAGQKRVIVEYGGVRFLLLVCYDLRFPVWIRNRGDYDATLIVASWPECRKKVWDTLLRARAIENQCYVLSVNRQGSDPGNNYIGGTYLINPVGEIIADAGKGNGQYCSSVTFDLDISDLSSKYRPTFPVLSDADNFEIL